MIRIGSLFTGIGGFDLGVEAALSEAGIEYELVFQVEIDDFCRAVLEKRWPNVDRSVTDVSRASYLNLPRVDWLIGGFPCQDVSSAGKGAGLDGERSGLWFAYRDVVEALRPRIVVVENVASGKRRYLCRVRRDLHALGYRTRAIQLGACDVGAPHRRERIFIVAHASSDGRGPWEPEPGRGSERTGPGQEPRPDDGREAVADAHGDRCEGERSDGLLDGEWSALGDDAHGRDGAAESSREPEDGRREVEPGLGRDADGLSAGVDRHPVQLPERWPAGRGQEQFEWEPPRTVEGEDRGVTGGKNRTRRPRLKALGNAVVPAQAREVVRYVLQSGFVSV